MLFRFTGEYTNGHTSISAWGIVFEGHEPTEVPADLAEKFARHPEFEAVVSEVQEHDLSALRAQYTAKMGKKPFHGWDAPTLIEKIA